ncbi:MAG: hypothetical protein RLN87_10165 [Parasphingopyxis sp.]|uniref:hypothetical protein n=1 Tax=Parasphingopyxis sp. TaxID=1920299 RepID=UPI0032EB7D0A
MNKINFVIAAAILVPTAAFAQQAEPHGEHSEMPCCERDADGNMAGCPQMGGDQAMDHGNMGQGMDHQNMDHGNMNHQNMDHDSMDHGDDGHDGNPMGAQ